jgi:RHS repeat-associated protein
MTFTYGPNGELKCKTVKTAAGSETWTYAYDPLGNLVTVTKPGTSTTTYTYIVDGQGWRVGKKEKIGTGATTLKQRWLYKDALNPVAELDATGAVVARYVYGSRRNVPDLVIKGGQVYRLFVDQLGSPRLAVNVANSSDVPYRVDYSAFGVATWKGTGAEAFDWIPFGFAGGIYDKDIRLVRFGARDYDPRAGRWVSKDPIRFQSNDAPNLYLYLNGDPVNFIDPTGRQAEATLPWWGGLLGGAAGGAAVGSAAGGVGALPGALIGACVGVLFLTSGDTPHPDCAQAGTQCSQGCLGELETDADNGDNWGFQRCIELCVRDLAC